jgi:hypothetical protein
LANGSARAKDRHIDEGGLFLPLASGTVLETTIDGEPELANGHVVAGETQFGVAGQVAHQDDFVEAGHRREV